MCSSCSAAACAILLSFRRSRQHQQVSHFSFLLPLSRLSFRSCYTFLRVSFCLTFSGTLGRNYPFFPTFPSGYSESMAIHFFQAMTQPMCSPDEVCSSSHLQSHTYSRSHLVSTLLLDWRHIVSSIFLDTQVPFASTEKLVLSHHARQLRSGLRYNGHSLLLNPYLFKIENSSCSTCGYPTQNNSHLILCCQLRTLRAARS